MKRVYWIGILAVVLMGCRQTAPAPLVEAKREAPEPMSATHWTATTELFVEYPPLAQGKTSRFAVHFTDLNPFRAVAQGAVEVVVMAKGGAPEVFRTNGPAKPGIFGLDVTPKAAGPYDLAIRLVRGGVADQHELGAANPPEEEKKEETIAFLKEQQWALDFGTGLAVERQLRESIRIPAEAMPRSGGEAVVTAPFDGRLSPAAFPVPGAKVTAGQTLANVIPPTSAPADLTTLEAAKEEADIALAQAKKERARAERLAATGAAPQKRVEEAKTWESTLEARRKAAEVRLAQYEASSTGEPGTRGAKWFALRAPIQGLVEEVLAAPGAAVKAGQPLFKIVDLDRVYVSAIVPESEYPRMRALSGAELEVPGLDRVLPMTKLVRIGGVVDAPSRTFPVVYEVDNTARRIAVNQTLQVRLLLAPGKPAAAVPESAIVDDAGRPVVFVQLEGEAFARRPVTLGRRAEGLVEVLAGVAAGERVVTKGAHLIRLAALSSQVPAHGHVH